MALDPWGSFGNLLVQWNGITLKFPLFSQKYSVKNSSFQNCFISKVSNPKGLAIYVSKIKPAKIFRLKLPKARINEGIRPLIFGHFLDIQKCPFWPLCVEVLKT
jgi:hypothetical protein